MLERYDMKMSCTVLRRERESNLPDLFDLVKSYDIVILEKQNGIFFKLFSNCSPLKFNFLYIFFTIFTCNFYFTSLL